MSINNNMVLMTIVTRITCPVGATDATDKYPIVVYALGDWCCPAPHGAYSKACISAPPGHLALVDDVQKSGKEACQTDGSESSMRLVGTSNPGTADKSRVNDGASRSASCVSSPATITIMA